ncbi:MAG: hypothetical protein H6728_13455 [Myxococcales bacterium]|nr:hypothetical protein [Myxococcales bacterium]
MIDQQKLLSPHKPQRASISRLCAQLAFCGVLALSLVRCFPEQQRICDESQSVFDATKGYITNPSCERSLIDSSKAFCTSLENCNTAEQRKANHDKEAMYTCFVKRCVQLPPISKSDPSKPIHLITPTACDPSNPSTATPIAGTLCRKGQQSAILGGTAQSECKGAIGVASPGKNCARLDEDCDGKLDQEAKDCECGPVGSLRHCYPDSRSQETINLDGSSDSHCRKGVQRCLPKEGSNTNAVGVWGSCQFYELPSTLACSGQDGTCTGSKKAGDTDTTSGLAKFCFLHGPDLSIQKTEVTGDTDTCTPQGGLLAIVSECTCPQAIQIRETETECQALRSKGQDCCVAGQPCACTPDMMSKGICRLCGMSLHNNETKCTKTFQFCLPSDDATTQNVWSACIYAENGKDLAHFSEVYNGDPQNGGTLVGKKDIYLNRSEKKDFPQVPAASLKELNQPAPFLRPHPEGDKDCDGIDNDCDGAIDNAADSTDSTLNKKDYSQKIGCFRGEALSVPFGNLTRRTCGYKSCLDPATSKDKTSLCIVTKEICNGIDDDCDGLIDNVPHSTTGAQFCDVDQKGTLGTYACSPDGKTVDQCVAAEICGNGKDDDNDGKVDESSCFQAQELCGDSIDNDGDGKTDESVCLQPE